METPFSQFMQKVTKENVVSFLQEKGLLVQTKHCDCGHDMAIQKFSQCSDGYAFRCNRCKKTKSIKDGRFFRNTSISLSKIMQLVFLWIMDTPVTTTENLLQISSRTAVQWYNYCRDVCSFKMVSLQQLLGGEGVIVQIDESLMFKRKNNMGRVVQQHWVFGMYDLSLRKGYLVNVPNRTTQTLIPIIQRWILPGTTIISDQWAAYNTLPTLGYLHFTVNHTQNFVDPQTGATTNHVEAFWSRIKRRLKYISSSQGDMKWSHLDEACYKHWYGFKSNNIWEFMELYLQHLREFILAEGITIQ